MTPAEKKSRSRILLAFAAVYVVWGSTYLFIKYAIETIPPFVMGAARFIIAGLLLYALARWRGGKKATTEDWKLAAITGVLMLGMGNGAVVWSETRVPSGIVALIVSSVPIWVVLLDWLRPRGSRPRPAVFFGLALGVAGMIILIGPRAIIGQGHVDGLGAGVLLIGSMSWAVGTLITRHTKRSGSPQVISALQMMAASAAMLAISIITGELRDFTPSAVSAKSVLSFIYLITFGSIIGYTAYVYLLSAVSATKAATYAYVNPVIAVLLGWAFANEPIAMRTGIAAAVILAGVALITTAQGRGQATGEHPIPSRPPERERTAA